MFYNGSGIKEVGFFFQPISFNPLLSVSFFLNFCAWGCFFLFNYQ